MPPEPIEELRKRHAHAEAWWLFCCADPNASETDKAAAFDAHCTAGIALVKAEQGGR